MSPSSLTTKPVASVRPAAQQMRSHRRLRTTAADEHFDFQHAYLHLVVPLRRGHFVQAARQKTLRRCCHPAASTWQVHDSTHGCASTCHHPALPVLQTPGPQPWLHASTSPVRPRHGCSAASAIHRTPCRFRSHTYTALERTASRAMSNVSSPCSAQLALNQPLPQRYAACLTWSVGTPVRKFTLSAL